MRKTVLAATALAAVAAAPSFAAGTAGPFAGQVRQGQTNHHTYDNNPTKGDCVQLATSYTVTLSYVTTTADVLTLTAGGKTASGNGASVSFWSGYCTTFDVAVTGTSVAGTAPYVVTVSRFAPIS